MGGDEERGVWGWRDRVAEAMSSWELERPHLKGDGEVPSLPGLMRTASLIHTDFN